MKKYYEVTVYLVGEAPTKSRVPADFEGFVAEKVLRRKRLVIHCYKRESWSKDGETYTAVIRKGRGQKTSYKFCRICITYPK